MKNLKTTLSALLIAGTLFGSCKSMNRTQKGAVIGTASGGVLGGIIGRASGNTALGAIIGATVGGVTGAVIGRKMDRQAAEIRKSIPNAKVERVGEGIAVEFSEKILFGYDQADLNAGAKRNLNKLVTILNKYSDTNIEIQGHTDDKGTDEYNLALSKRRASSVSDYLNAQGVSNSRLTTVGYGEGAPKYTNDTPTHQAQNRRVEFMIYANDKMKAEAEAEAAKK